MENKRKAISAGELYVILDREFRTRQSRDCASCYILLPYRVDRSDDGSANWELVIPPDCPHGCAEVVDELVQRYSKVYDLAPDNGD
jgi:hypothetical protein